MVVNVWYSSSKSALVRNKQNLFLFSPVCHVFFKHLLWHTFDKKGIVNICLIAQNSMCQFYTYLNFEKNGLISCLLGFLTLDKPSPLCLTCFFFFLSADVLQNGYLEIISLRHNCDVHRKFPSYIMAFFFFFNNIDWIEINLLALDFGLPFTMREWVAFGPQFYLLLSCF